ncbi:DUF222 domain-containing protein, partial [Mycobacterium sp. PS03-16]
MSTLTGLLDPEGRALLDALIAHYNGDKQDTSNDGDTTADDAPIDAPVDSEPGDPIAGEPAEHSDTPEPPTTDTITDIPPSDPPDAPIPPWLERETKSQRDYDALKAGLRLALASGALGTRHGLPASIVVTTTLDDLEKAAGYARTAGG